MMFNGKFKTIGYLCLGIAVVIVVTATIFYHPLFILGVLFLMEGIILLHGYDLSMAGTRFLFGDKADDGLAKAGVILYAILLGIAIILFIGGLIYWGIIRH